MDDKCKKIMECISDYLDGEATEELCKMVEKHLLECSECKCVFENLKNTVEMLHNLPEEEIPGNIEQSVLKKLKKILFK
ncbi:conserved hypothetical protein [Thermotomaculum hydrothermale]|uniref:Putative zinc-finger domain-containing protein n=1 Tax=Thermotomaculum hydrothermale TaxID=981385 RepID=A0A7R6SYV5_9BACT|nr:zf-HC2 domain-containing protein [Thermotomaculum hydrothermale]BBB33194.1 conserved hypothetical protein [Thermotomaculum hydrothermale]